MKLIIQIPCHNEEKTLPLVIRDLPKKVESIDEIEVLVINDGSTDRTAEVARSLGVRQIVNISKCRGLAYAFRAGIEKSLELGADIIVNTDGDNQYQGSCVKDLVRPIITKNAQVVIGCRDISSIRHFSFIKKLLQRLGSHFVRKFSNTEIPDVTSGFRALSREAAMRTNVFSDYTYTIETIIQAGRNNLHIEWVQIKTNPKTRESRLIKSTAGYIFRSAATLLRIYLMYEPLKTFFYLGILPIAVSLFFIVRFVIDHFTRARGGGHVQSLVLAAVLFIVGFTTVIIGLLGDIIAANRKINEEILLRLKQRER